MRWFIPVLTLLTWLSIPSKPTKAQNCTTPAGVLEGVQTSLGVLCAECNYRGRVTASGDCNCTESFFDPRDACLQPGESLPVPEVSLTAQVGQANCSCYTDPTYGYFRLTTNYSAVAQPKSRVGSVLSAPVHVYGTPLPAVCDECYSDLYGPKPGTVTASLQERELSLCREYGGPDPNVLFQLSDFLFGLFM